MALTHAVVDLDRVDRRYTGLQMRFAALQGRASELRSRQGALVKDISLAKARLELAPQAQETFVYLQERAHARAVGEFEGLLSAFVEDVIPEAGEIRLELGTERGAPSLDITLDNGGNLENILDGNGGGLTNVVVTGLVFAALSRTTNRSLVVLDEPDCWLKATRVPAFTKVIAEVANPRTNEDGTRDPGCQTLMISHNDTALMDEGAHIIELYMDDGVPQLRTLSGARAWLDDDEEGVRWVELENVRIHQKTRMELCPGLNVLAGDVNCGKSTLFVSAFRAMAYGESDDTLIRHGADQAVIRMGLERGVVLEMIRQRKGSPKVLFRRLEHGVVTNEGRPEVRGSVPDFIVNALRITRVDDLDIQLRSQKQPVFLLNETPARRAQLLSVGKESGLLQNLIERHRLTVRRDRDQLKRDEAELSTINRTLLALRPLAPMASLLDIISGLQTESRENTAALTALRNQVERLDGLSGRNALAGALRAQERSVPRAPTPSATEALFRLTRQLEKTRLLALVQLSDEKPTAPSIVDTRKGNALLTQLVRLSAMARLSSHLPRAPIKPVVPTTALMAAGIAKVEKLLAEGTRLAQSFKACENDERGAKAAFEHIKSELGVCPLCDTPLAAGAHTHD